MTERTCSIDGCEKKAVRRGWCSMHYLRWYRHGELGPAEPLSALRVKVVKPPKPTYEQAFWAKVQKTDSCWLWVAAKNRKGYGHYRHKMAHRVAYELAVGDIPEGLQLDHLCRVPSCVNPDHLEPVTPQENIIRGQIGGFGRAWTECPQGHPYDETNLRLNADGHRYCRRCNADKASAWWERKKRSA